MHFVAHVLGLDNASGPWYLFWSGFAGDLPEFAGVAIVWRRMNCHKKGCWRVGLHRHQGGHYVTCRKHKEQT